MTHTQAILHELAEHGQTTYKALVARYGDAGYTYGGFTSAMRYLRIAGVAARRGRIIVALRCPHCGRAMEQPACDS